MMTDTENKRVDQLWYTWSDVGLGTVHAGFRIRAASSGLSDIYSERTKGLDRHTRYVLPPGTNRLAIQPDQAPLCLTFLRTDQPKEAILVHKKYVGQDAVGRPGNFFTHLYALGNASEEFSASDAIWLWGSNIWKTADELDRRNNTLNQVSLESLQSEQYASFRPIYAQIQEQLPFVIEAYLTRREHSPLYIAAPADACEKIATLIAGLVRCLPQQLYAKLTFSTYEPDITKATTQIVGASWVAGQENRSQPVFPPQFYRERLAINCATNEHSALQNHPLASSNTLVAHFAQFATECLLTNDVEALDTLLEEAEKSEDLDVDQFLHLYEDTTINAEKLAAERIERYLQTPAYRVDKLYSKGFRDQIISLAANQEYQQRWMPRLKSILQQLQQQSLQEFITPSSGRKGNPASPTTKSRKKTSASEPRRDGKKRRGNTASLAEGQEVRTLTQGLSLLAFGAASAIVRTMKTSATPGTPSYLNQQVASEIGLQRDKEFIRTLLDLMDAAVPTSEAYQVWKKLLQDMSVIPEACRFMTTNWDIYSRLCVCWNAVLPDDLESDGLMHPLLTIPWSWLGAFLQLQLRPQWNRIATEMLLPDRSPLTPKQTQQLQAFSQEINLHLRQLMSNPQTRPLATSFAIALIERNYTADRDFYPLVQHQCTSLINDQQLLPAYDLIIALAKNGVDKRYYLNEAKIVLPPLLTTHDLHQQGQQLFDVILPHTDERDKNELLKLLLQSSPHHRAFATALERVYKTPEELDSFFVLHGSNYLASAEQMTAMIDLYTKLLSYPGRPNRLAVLLDKLVDQSSILHVWDLAQKLDEHALILQRKGRDYLTHYQRVPQLAKRVVDTFDRLVEAGHQDSKNLLFDLFSAQTRDSYLEQILQTGLVCLSWEERATFLKRCSTDHLHFFYNSPIGQNILAGIAQIQSSAQLEKEARDWFSAEKMAILLLWLDPVHLHDGSLKLNFVKDVLQAASLTPDEQIQFLEKYGADYLASCPHLPMFAGYVGNYISYFTADRLDQPGIQQLLLRARTLSLSSDIQQCIGNWLSLSEFFANPSANEWKLTNLAEAIDRLSLPDNAQFTRKLASSQFTKKLASAFVLCIRSTEHLKMIMDIMVTHVPEFKGPQFNGQKMQLLYIKMQLLYIIAEQAAETYNQQRYDASFLAPYILFVLEDSVDVEGKAHFVHCFLETLLLPLRYNLPDNLNHWHRLEICIKQPQPSEQTLKQWYGYLSKLKLLEVLEPEQAAKKAQKKRPSTSAKSPDSEVASPQVNTQSNKNKRSRSQDPWRHDVLELGHPQSVQPLPDQPDNTLQDQSMYTKQDVYSFHVENKLKKKKKF